MKNLKNKGNNKNNNKKFKKNKMNIDFFFENFKLLFKKKFFKIKKIIKF